MAPALTAQGITFVSAGYRLAPQSCIPGRLSRTCWTRSPPPARQSRQFGGKPDRIFISGHSAGGHLAALAALRNDWTARRNLPANVIRGALADLGLLRFRRRLRLFDAAPLSRRARTAADRTASPVQYIRPDAPPFFITWGENDFPHLTQTGRGFRRSLARGRCRCRNPRAAGLRPSRRKLRKRRTARPLGERGGALDAGALMLQPAIRVTRSKQAIRRHPRARSRRFLARFRRSPCAGRRERRRQIDAHSNSRRRASCR